MRIKIGNVYIGDGERIAIQSMTNTKTTDIDGTVAQIKRLEECGCDIVRASVPDRASAEAFKEITASVDIPVVADVHFDYRLAIAAAENGAAKIRINPGNIGGTDKVKAVADVMKERGLPIRIGVNSGSIEKQFANLPIEDAMARSAMYHAQLLENADFHDIVLSVKSSGVRETVGAYRKLRSICNYPLHLGVTEAGIKETGIIKSAVGIGALLLDGIGDTVRVSLTADPIEEITAAKAILDSIGMGGPHVEIISCPTCARTEIDVEGLARKVAVMTAGLKKSAKIAVMGCIVNGPGEAKRCDFGIAGGKDKSAIFIQGEVVKTVENRHLEQEIARFIDEIILK